MLRTGVIGLGALSNTRLRGQHAVVGLNERMSAECEQGAVLALLKGEHVELVSRDA